ncbi:MAG: glycosyltransferase family 4 protein [Planctomycetota bacterium]|nr:glycosyltransferase family 4 protein [Planctomycetota bacterium]MDG1984750.1 glycosyltransferase family 4 protein [Planctomycetota bacterium]
MNILFYCEIADPGVGSSVRQMYGLARELRARGHRTAVVATVRDAADATPTVIDGTTVFRLHSDYPLRWRGWVSLRNRTIERPLAAVLGEFRPDVVHAHLVHTHLGYHSLTMAKQAGARVIFTSHDAMTFCYQKLTCFHGGEEHGGELDDVVARSSKCVPCQRLRFRPGRNRRIRQVLERDVDRVTVVSNELGRVMRANELPVHRTVHNALELNDPPGEDAVLEFRRRHGLEGCKVLAIGGRLHAQKGVGKLLEMLALLRPEFSDVRLIVMGRRETYDDEFKPEAARLGVDDLVVPTGWLGPEELPLAYAAADVFVTPSLCFDTFGIVNLEAMEQRRPVVATRFGGSMEVVEDGVSGFIENPFNLAAYAERIAQLLRDGDLRARMGDAGRVALLEHFSMERLTDEFLQEYSAAAGPGSRVT